MAKMTEKQLAARDAKRDLAAELLQAIREMKAGKAARVRKVSTSRKRQNAHLGESFDRGRHLPLCAGNSEETGTRQDLPEYQATTFDQEAPIARIRSAATTVTPTVARSSRIEFPGRCNQLGMACERSNRDMRRACTEYRNCRLRSEYRRLKGINAAVFCGWRLFHLPKATA